jgi:hypothetical protein
MKCPSCGRMMVNMITFLKCSNGYCDYEEDIESVQVSTDTKQVRPAANFYKPVAAWQRTSRDTDYAEIRLRDPKSRRGRDLS